MESICEHRQTQLACNNRLNTTRAGSSGTFIQNGGTLTTWRTQVSDAANTSSFVQTGGTHTTRTLDLTGNSSASQGTYTLGGSGLLVAGQVTAGDAGISGTSTFHFAGGTLQPSASNASFFQGLTTADVGAGGAKIDTNGYDVTLAQSLLSGTAGGTVDGGLTKLRGGTLTLAGTNAYTGATTISVGTLQVGSSGTSGSLGTGNIVDNGALVFNRSNGIAVLNNINGNGSLTQAGTGTLLLGGNNTYTGATTISAGTIYLVGYYAHRLTKPRYP